jgi:hypothetical protein
MLVFGMFISVLPMLVQDFVGGSGSVGDCDEALVCRVTGKQTVATGSLRLASICRRASCRRASPKKAISTYRRFMGRKVGKYFVAYAGLSWVTVAVNASLGAVNGILQWTERNFVIVPVAVSTSVAAIAWHSQFKSEDRSCTLPPFNRRYRNSSFLHLRIWATR